ncbi:MAG: bifunctional DNA-formamidopyrimidine glycosylase/DNA-(apurinic or apyrimidinic site) lyase [Solirubrobacterales bacterium]|nr:bifunctional DNA-formamidopyrimidine glycosylase/DNA-(apurinic or apyrimidinic site) lyase [Solirubrobacterales bacterium]
MPELPEVETIRRQLAPNLKGRTIEQLEILDPRWTRPWPPEAVQADVAGARIESLSRAGKYLIWALSADRYLLMHLRMTGALLFDPEVEPPHTRVRFALDAGHWLAYVDPRRFGTGHLVHGAEARDSYLAERLGIEPFTERFTIEHLHLAGRGRLAPIKAFLLDQRRIAGVGNIYADEALYRARVHPLRPTGSLTRAQWQRLHEGIEDALRAGIEAKGASIDDFRHIDGAQGSFQDQFLVHRREGKPCPRCGREIRKLVVGGRGTYVCERCQPRPRARRATPPAVDSSVPRDRRRATARARPTSHRRSRSEER